MYHDIIKCGQSEHHECTTLYLECTMYVASVHEDNAMRVPELYLTCTMHVTNVHQDGAIRVPKQYLACTVCVANVH